MASSITEFEILTKDIDFLTWVPLISEIQTSFPELVKICDASLSYELQQELENKLGNEYVLYGENYVQIQIKDGSGKKKNIYYRDIAKWTGYIDSYSITFENNFLFLVTSPATGQAGTLGIWDFEKEEWFFIFSDEEFCVRHISFISSKKIFIGYTYFQYPVSQINGFNLFTIDQFRKIKFHHPEKFTNAPPLSRNQKEIYLQVNDDEIIAQLFIHNQIVEYHIKNMST
jgi:hypothetical protein